MTTGQRADPASSVAASAASTNTTLPLADAGLQRAVVENVRPNVDGGRFPVKRVLGDRFEVTADAFADGHDVVEAWLRIRHASDPTWLEQEMDGPDNDRWTASVTLDRVGRWQYSVVAWTDRFSSWQRDLRKRLDAGQDVTLDLRIGVELIAGAAERATDAGADRDARTLRAWAVTLAAPDAPARAADLALDPDATTACRRHPDRRHVTAWEPPLEVVVDPRRGGFSAWYELFPRSASPDPSRHGTLQDVIARLDYVADLGFDVLYLPPIHPIGRTFRKGPNNVEAGGPGDPGVPWAIGAGDGGHTAVHGALGTHADVRALVAAARDRGIEVALDIAFQASPDHPWVREHPTWFRARPDGTIQYAENPPKKYQDIYPFDFESEDWRGLWSGLRDVFEFWIGQGITIFRVDNPHTKAFPFWEWCIGALKADHPEVLFLAEAFTRPKPMYRLAKLGFSQSYTYFTWRNSARDLADYVTELTTTDVREFFRPNFWPNTPDILHADLQRGGRPMFLARFVLAATLSSNYGIYGPAFELGSSAPREAGSEEYLDSEKYQQRTWDLHDPASLRQAIAIVNRARREHPALQRMAGTRFHATGNDQLLAYSRRSGDDWLVVVVSFDPNAPQSGRLALDMAALGLHEEETLHVVELLSGVAGTLRTGQLIELDPARSTALLFAPATRVATSGAAGA